MVVRFDKAALIEHQTNKDVGVETGSDTGNKISEADKIVAETRQSIIEGSSSGIGVSASNSGRGHDPVAIENEGDFVPTTLSEHLEEEPSAIEEEEEDEKGNAPVRNNIVPKREEPTVAEAKVAEEEKPAEESSATKVQ
jgi:protein phosphatase PTC1